MKNKSTSTHFQDMDRAFTSVTVCSMDAAFEPTGMYSRLVTEVNARSVAWHQTYILPKLLGPQ